MIDEEEAPAVAYKGWRWMPGMHDELGRIWTGRFFFDPDRERTLRRARSWGIRLAYYDPRPDFRDAATRGCVLELVREAWGDPFVYILRTNSGWWAVHNGRHERIAHGDTEGEALVAALKAAPK